MDNNIQLIRAIGSEFVLRKYRSFVVVLFIFIAVLLSGAIYLTTLSAWWWLLAVPVIGGGILLVIIAVLAGLVVKLLRPNITKMQRSSVADFVDKLERVADGLQTPPFIVLFRVVKDVVRPGKTPFLQSMAQDSTSLKSDYITLQRSFYAKS